MTNPTPAPERISLPNGWYLKQQGGNVLVHGVEYPQYKLHQPNGELAYNEYCNGEGGEFHGPIADAFAAAMNAPTDEVLRLREVLERSYNHLMNAQPKIANLGNPHTVFVDNYINVIKDDIKAALSTQQEKVG